MRRSNARPPAAVENPGPSITMSASKPHLLRIPSLSSTRLSLPSPSYPKHCRRADGGGGSRLSAFLAVPAIAVAFLFLFFFSRGLSPPKFSIFVDGGSTGSRIHVFAYRTGWRGIPTLDLGLTAAMKTSPGLSSYSADPETAGRSLVELLEFGKARVPQGSWADTEVRLMATAGLRSLDYAVVKRILESCRKVLRSSGFRFQDEWAAVISGSDEGIYAWVAANYALGTLGSDPDKTTGIFELGGASAQATFVSNEPLAPEISRVLRFGKLAYSLYSQSFLYLGQNVAYDSLHDFLSSGVLKSSTDFIQEESYADPCTPRGYVHGVKSEKLSTGLLNSKATFRSSHPIGNFSGCRVAAMKLLEKEKGKCMQQTCRLGLMSMPKLPGKLFATENFFHTVKFFGLGPTPLISELILAGERYCAQDWSTIKKKYYTHQEEDLLRFCFSSAYIVALLHDTLGIAMDDTRVVFANRVGSTPLDWALGAFIIHQSIRPNADGSDWITAILRRGPSSWLSIFVVSIALTLTTWSVLRWMKPKLKIIYDLQKGGYILTPLKR